MRQRFNKPSGLVGIIVGILGPDSNGILMFFIVIEGSTRVVVRSSGSVPDHLQTRALVNGTGPLLRIRSGTVPRLWEALAD